MTNREIAWNILKIASEKWLEPLEIEIFISEALDEAEQRGRESRDKPSNEAKKKNQILIEALLNVKDNIRSCRDGDDRTWEQCASDAQDMVEEALFWVNYDEKSRG